MKKKIKVAVAMSGGVDSSVAAALLKKEGFEVIGLTMKLWPTEKCGEEKRHSCCSLRDVEDARAVAVKLDIPFYVMNLSNEFEEEVIQYFIGEYKNGRTPNPCIVCNTRIKFGRLWQKARGLGADYIATGHYARVKYEKDNGRYVLCRGRDETKDQSYVLFELNQEQLSKVIFPLGELKKPDVRAISERLGLPVCQKPESQEICFISDKDYSTFLKSRGMTGSPGDIVDSAGGVLGRHQGVHTFTIGQRKRLGLSGRPARHISGGGPLYVISIKMDDNTIIVGREQDLEKDTLVAFNLSWVNRENLGNGFTVEAKIRYNHKPAEALVVPMEDGRVRVEFAKPQKAITPGQAVVFYRGEMVIGGGWIEK